MQSQIVQKHSQIQKHCITDDYKLEIIKSIHVLESKTILYMCGMYKIKPLQYPHMCGVCLGGG